MEAHELYQLAMPRGAAGKVGREIGYADSSIPKAWRRPLATSTNLFTGNLSPLMKAKRELLAHDRVNSDAADILLFDLFADLARQRAQRNGDDADAVLIAVTQSYHRAIDALLAADQHTEEKLYRAGASLVRALLFVIGDDGKGAPLMKAESGKTVFERAIAWLKR
jgi:hypothetical protein